MATTPNKITLSSPEIDDDSILSIIAASLTPYKKTPKKKEKLDTRKEPNTDLGKPDLIINNMIYIVNNLI